MDSLKNDPLVVVATCNDMFAAHIIAEKLEANEISTFVRNCTDIAYLSSPYASTGEYRVYVLKENKDRAEAILKD